MIRSHVIDGHAVLPLALILEWLAEGALHRHPGLVVRGIDDLRLFKGVVLRDHKPAAVSIRVGKARAAGRTQVVPVELRGRARERPRGHPRPGRGGPRRSITPPGERKLVEAELFPLAADPEEIYHRILFHGPAMQAIQRVEGCDDRAIGGLGLDVAPARRPGSSGRSARTG